MLDMFKRPTDPPEYNGLYALSAAALLATYAAGHFAGECGRLIAVSSLQLEVLSSWVRCVPAHWWLWSCVPWLVTKRTLPDLSP